MNCFNTVYYSPADMTTGIKTIANPKERISHINIQVGDKVRRLRLRYGMSRQELARRVGVSVQQFEKYESGINRISSGMLFAIAEILHVSVSYFFSDQKENNQETIPSELHKDCQRLIRDYITIKNNNHKEIIQMLAQKLASSEL